MARHLHEQSGGNPRDHGPVPELANEPRSPRSSDDFPDAPEAEERSGPGGDLTEDQLDDFAARLGLTDDPGDRAGEEDRPAEAEDSAGATGEPSDERPGLVRRVVVHRVRWIGRPVGRVMLVMARVAGGTGRWLHATGERFAANEPRR